MNTKALRQKILDLAIRGQLVPQDPNEEPAELMLRRINPNAKVEADGPFQIPASWAWTSLGEICTFLSRGKSPKYKDEDKTYPVFAQKCNLKDGGISLDNARFLDPLTLSKWSDEYKLRTGDILINSTGTGTVGRTRLFSDTCLGQYPFVVPDSHVSVVRTHQDISSSFIYFYIASDLTQKYLENNLAGSTNQKELYIGILKYMLIPLPPKEEQVRIVSSIVSWFSLISKIESGQEELKSAVKQAKSKILDLAIHGQLVPQNPNDEPANVLLQRINPNAETITDGPFQIPASWAWTALGEISSYGKCTNVPVEEIKDSEWVLELEDIEKDSANIVQRLNRCKRPISGVRHKFSKGAILYSKLRTYLNKVLVAPDAGYCTTEIIPFSTYDCILNDYICHVLRSQYFLDYTIQCGYGVKMPRLSTKDACKGLIPLPPKQEQVRIVKKITELFAKLDAIEAQL